MNNFRPDATFDIANAIKEINLKEPLTKSCYNCEYVDLDNNKCKKYNVMPPIKIIVFGCESWEYYRIPF